LKFVFELSEFFIASVIIFYSGFIFIKSAFQSLKNGVIGMDFLVASGSLASYFYSIFVLISGEGETYFDSASMIIVFILFGRYLEVVSKQRALESLEHIQEIPRMINVLNDDGAVIPKVARLINKGDKIQINTTDKVVIDGVVISGKGYFDLSVITGESNPVLKKKGDKILSGSIALETDIVYEASGGLFDSFLIKLTKVVEKGLVEKSLLEKKITTISGYFGIGVVTISILTFLMWFFVLHYPFSSSFIIAISVIVIACPCALALSTPIAIAITIDSLLKKNIICKTSGVFNKIRDSKVVVFDKTKTLTTGLFEVKKLTKLDDFDENIVSSILRESKHPVSVGAWKFINRKVGIKEYAPEKTEVIISKGVKASFVVEGQNKIVVAGSVRFLKEEGVSLPCISSHHSIIGVAIDDVLVCYFEMQDDIKSESTEVVDKLKSMGFDLCILSGDEEQPTKDVAKQLGISKYRSRFSPEDKSLFVKELQKNDTKVLMIGDGINDTMALKSSDVSISFCNSDNVTIKSSDVVFMNSNLKNIIFLVLMSKAASSLIKQNLSMSVIYNVFAICFAVAGFVSPLVAAIIMSISSLLVVFNSIRVKYKSLYYSKI
jgi:Cu+-exporting ATPase